MSEVNYVTPRDRNVVSYVTAPIGGAVAGAWNGFWGGMWKGIKGGIVVGVAIAAVGAALAATMVFMPAVAAAVGLSAGSVLVGSALAGVGFGTVTSVVAGAVGAVVGPGYRGAKGAVDGITQVRDQRSAYKTLGQEAQLEFQRSRAAQRSAQLAGANFEDNGLAGDASGKRRHTGKPPATAHRREAAGGATRQPVSVCRLVFRTRVDAGSRLVVGVAPLRQNKIAQRNELAAEGRIRPEGDG